MKPLLDVTAVIDRSRLGSLQWTVLALCALCLVIDGFDVQAMGYVAPALIAQWGIAKAELGPVFGAGLVGMALGAVLLGPVADRVGRRPVLIGAMLCLAACMAGTASADSVRALLAWRFVTGLGMGAIIPNAVALAGEYSPARMRVTLMMVTSSGFIAGGVLGGAASAMLIPAFGWRSVFFAGAVAPLLVGLAMLVLLPESLQFLALQRRRLDRVLGWLRRIDPSLAAVGDADIATPERRADGAPVIQLFRQRRAIGTLLLWLINFMNLLAAYFLANWLPVIMTGAGHGASQAVLAATVFWIGGLLGNLSLGWCVDRRGFGPTLTATFVVAAASIALVGQVASSMAAACAVIAVAGFCVLGGQTALNALAAVMYPTAVRSTGMGWALGIGRLGSIFGPVLGGELLRLDWAPAQLFIAAAVPALVSLFATLVFWRLRRLPPAAGATAEPSGARTNATSAPRPRQA